jgi:hypothetical protein
MSGEKGRWGSADGGKGSGLDFTGCMGWIIRDGRNTGDEGMNESVNEWMMFLSAWQTAGCLLRYKMCPVQYSTEYIHAGRACWSSTGITDLEALYRKIRNELHLPNVRYSPYTYIHVPHTGTAFQMEFAVPQTVPRRLRRRLNPKRDSLLDILGRTR